MTYREAREAVAAMWPGIFLVFHHGTIAFYKEGWPTEDSFVSDDYVLCSPGLGHGIHPGHSGPAVLTGTATPQERHAQIYTAFGLEEDFSVRYRHEAVTRAVNPGQMTLDEAQAAMEQWEAAFAAKHGRSPRPHDSFAGLAPAP